VWCAFSPLHSLCIKVIIGEGFEIGEGGEGEAGTAVDEAGNISAPKNIVRAPPRKQQGNGIVSRDGGVNGPDGPKRVRLMVQQNVVIVIVDYVHEFIVLLFCKYFSFSSSNTDRRSAFYSAFLMPYLPAGRPAERQEHRGLGDGEAISLPLLYTHQYHLQLVYLKYYRIYSIPLHSLLNPPCICRQALQNTGYSQCE